MTRAFMSPMVYTFVRCSLGLVFVYSGVMKLLDLQGFASVIEAYGLIPWQFKSFAALVIASTEAVAGTGLLLDLKGSLAVVVVMLAVFMAVLGFGIHMGYDIDCGCFGEDDPVGQAMHGLGQALIRDVVFCAGAFYCYTWRYRLGHRPVSLMARIRQITKNKER